MPVTPEDLIQPEGRLEPDMFASDDPGGETFIRVAIWITEGYTLVADLSSEAEKDLAVGAWVYYRAFDSLANRLSQQPSSVTLEGGNSRVYSASQIQRFRALADEYKTEFDAYFPEIPLGRAEFGAAQTIARW